MKPVESQSYTLPPVAPPSKIMCFFSLFEQSAYTARVQLLHESLVVVGDILDFDTIVYPGIDLVQDFIDDPGDGAWFNLESKLFEIIDNDWRHYTQRVWQILISSPLDSNIPQRAFGLPGNSADFSFIYSRMAIVSSLLSLVPSMNLRLSDIRSTGALFLDIGSLLSDHGKLLYLQLANDVMINYMLILEEMIGQAHLSLVDELR